MNLFSTPSSTTLFSNFSPILNIKIHSQFLIFWELLYEFLILDISSFFDTHSTLLHYIDHPTLYSINHFELSAVYPASGKIIMDVPLTVTYLQYGSEISRIENHHNAPVGLIKFEEHIELLINNLDFELVN